MEITFFAIGILLGLLIGYLVMKSKVGAAAMQSDAECQQLRSNMQLLAGSHATALSDRDAHIAALTGKADALNATVLQLTAARTQAEAERDAALKKLDEQAAHLDEQFRQMEERFRNIAADVVKAGSTDITRLGTDTLRTIIDPFKEQLGQFRERVDKCYGDEAKERFSLQNEIRLLVEANQKIGEEANGLATALKGNGKIQGDWGEMILDTILQQSGLKEGIHYVKQQYIRDEFDHVATGDEGSRMRTDLEVNFPDGRKMIIDSKVSLTAYLSYVNAPDKDTADKALRDHLRSITSHIDELSKVDYSKYYKQAPDFVMMFIPNESAYYLATQANPDLWNYAYKRKVVIVTPTNLVTALRLSLDLWRRDDQIKNLDRIVQTATSLYDKVVLFRDSMDAVGRSLGNATAAYNQAMDRLGQGRGNVLATTQRLIKYGITPKRRISAPDTDDDDTPDDNKKDIE